MTRRRRKPPAKSFFSSELTAMIYDLLALDPPKTHGTTLERVLKRLESGKGPTQSQLRKIEHWFETNLPQHQFDTDPDEFFQMMDEIPKGNRSLKPDTRSIAFPPFSENSSNRLANSFSFSPRPNCHLQFVKSSIYAIYCLG